MKSASFMVNLRCPIPASLAGWMVIQIEIPVNGVFFVLFCPFFGNWAKPSASFEGSFPFKWGALHSVKERITQVIANPARINMKHSFIVQIRLQPF